MTDLADELPQRKSAIQKAKESPIVSTLTLVTIVIGSITAIGGFTGTWDGSHTTEVELTESFAAYELSHPHPVTEQKIVQIQRESQCNAIDIRISLAEQAIWQMVQAGDNSQRLVEKRRELIRLEARRTQLQCGSVL